MATIIRTLTCVLVVLVWDLAYQTAEAQIKAGFAERDITPDIGMEQPGGYHKSFHRSFHDPCKVRVALFDDGQRRVAVIGVDALALPGQLVKKCRQRLQDQVGLPPEAVLIAASHSHSSGPVGMVQPGEYDHASPLVQKLAYEDSSMANPEYLKRMEEAIVEAVSAANEKRSEVACGFGSGCENQVAFNRRFRMRNGLTYTHPGAGNPEIVEAAGPTDPEVGVIGAWDGDGKLLGCIVNFACHATTSPGGISANYIYYLEQVVRGAMGPDVIVVFTARALVTSPRSTTSPAIRIPAPRISPASSAAEWAPKRSRSCFPSKGKRVQSRLPIQSAEDRTPRAKSGTGQRHWS